MGNALECPEFIFPIADPVIDDQRDNVSDVFIGSGGLWEMNLLITSGIGFHNTQIQQVGPAFTQYTADALVCEGDYRCLLQSTLILSFYQSGPIVSNG